MLQENLQFIKNMAGPAIKTEKQPSSDLHKATFEAKGAAPGAATYELANCERNCTPQQQQPGQSPSASLIQSQHILCPMRPYRDYFYISQL